MSLLLFNPFSTHVRFLKLLTLPCYTALTWTSLNQTTEARFLSSPLIPRRSKLSVNTPYRHVLSNWIPCANCITRLHEVPSCL